MLRHPTGANVGVRLKRPRARSVATPNRYRSVPCCTPLYGDVLGQPAQLPWLPCSGRVTRISRVARRLELANRRSGISSTPTTRSRRKKHSTCRARRFEQRGRCLRRSGQVSRWDNSGTPLSRENVKPRDVTNLQVTVAKQFMPRYVGRDKQFLSFHTARVTGSIPVPPTSRSVVKPG